MVKPEISGQEIKPLFLPGSTNSIPEENVPSETTIDSVCFKTERSDNVAEIQREGKAKLFEIMTESDQALPPPLSKKEAPLTEKNRHISKSKDRYMSISIKVPLKDFVSNLHPPYLQKARKRPCTSLSHRKNRSMQTCSNDIERTLRTGLFGENTLIAHYLDFQFRSIIESISLHSHTNTVTSLQSSRFAHRIFNHRESTVKIRHYLFGYTNRQNKRNTRKRTSEFFGRGQRRGRIIDISKSHINKKCLCIRVVKP